MRVNYLKSRIKDTDLAAFLKQLQILYSAGLSLPKIIDLLEKRFCNLPVGQISWSLDQGENIADSLRCLKVEASVIDLLEVGENTGHLEDALRQAADLLDKRISFRRNLRNLLTYPAFILLASFLCILGLLIFILPSFSQIFTDFGYSLPPITRFFIFLPNLWPWLCLVLLMILYFVWQIRVNDRSKQLIPGYKETQAIRLARSLGAQIKSSVSVLTALDNCIRSSDREYAKALKCIRGMVENGEKFSSALARFSRLFPETLVQMIAVGEESGTLDEMLFKAADYFEVEVENRIKRMTLFIEPVSTLAVGLIVGMVAFAMIMPLFSIMNSLL
ncbi:MAG: type II secretion system F family protein [Candidatus Margulisiibacteriota bacterium]